MRLERTCQPPRPTVASESINLQNELSRNRSLSHRSARLHAKSCLAKSGAQGVTCGITKFANADWTHHAETGRSPPSLSYLSRMFAPWSSRWLAPREFRYDRRLECRGIEATRFHQIDCGWGARLAARRAQHAEAGLATMQRP